jgi:hypothetical protein
MISQTSYIAAALFLGFIVFVTIRGELPQYQAAIFGAPSGAGPAKQ